MLKESKFFVLLSLSINFYEFYCKVSRCRQFAAPGCGLPVPAPGSVLRARGRWAPHDAGSRGQADQLLRQVRNFDRTAHIQNAQLALLRHGACLSDKLDSLGLSSDDPRIWRVCMGAMLDVDILSRQNPATVRYPGTPCSSIRCFLTTSGCSTVQD